MPLIFVPSCIAKRGKWLKPVNQKNASDRDRRVRTVLHRLAERTAALPDKKPGLLEVLFFLEDRQTAVTGHCWSGEQNVNSPRFLFFLHLA